MLDPLKSVKRNAWIVVGVSLSLLSVALFLGVRSGPDDSGGAGDIMVADGVDRFDEVRTVGHNEPIGAGKDRVRGAGADSKGRSSKSLPEKEVRQVVVLWNVTPAQFESRLLEAMGGRLASRGGPGGRVEYRLGLSRSGGPRLFVDRTEKRVSIEGEESAVRGVSHLVHALDESRPSRGVAVRCVSIPRSQGKAIGRLIEAVRMDGGSRVGDPVGGPEQVVARPVAEMVQMEPGEGLPSSLPRPRSGAPGESTQPAESPAPEQPSPAVPVERPSEPGSDAETLPTVEGGRLVAPVQIQVLEGMDAIVIRGRPEDVKRVADLVRQIETFSKAMVPATEVVLLQYVDATALGTLLDQLYEEILSAREGTVSITPLAAPNGLLLIGRPESVEKLKGLIAQLDVPVSPTAQFRVFRLKTVPAEEAQENITSFFEEADDAEGTAMLPRVHVVADFRSNSLIVRARPNDMAEVAAIIARIDSGDSDSFNEVRVFKLKNASAETLAPILQDAVTGQMYGQRARTGPSVGTGMGRAEDYERKSTRLKLITIDAKGHKILNSGILTDAQVTADPRTNGLIVTASADSMPLIAALIQQLDSAPSIEAQVKVFTLVNGDATNMAEMLQNIFGAAVAGDEIAVRTGVVPEETSLVGLNFAVDVRTNSIIVTGSAGALTVVEAVLARLDGSDPRERKTAVVRIKNIQAEDVATAVNEYLTTKRDIETSNEGVLSVFEQIEREVIVVAEPASNSIIISATPRYFDDITKLVEEIDRRQAMIMIQVVIAEVSLNDFSEFGVEVGLEDSILFNRNLATSGLAVPGTLFSDGIDTGSRGLTSFGTGQVNTDLSFGGLVLNASSESVSVLVRALQSCSRVKVLSRPQIMTLDNEPAQIVVGEDVPFITGTSFSEFGQQNSIDYREVGLILTVTPRVSAEGLVVMEIVATNSKVGPIDEGIPVSVAGGEVIRSPRIEMISAQTVVSSMNGQTVVMGGLIIEDNRIVSRRVPWISSIPVVGNLFKYESKTKDRKELLIIMTPRIVENAVDADRIAQVEACRLHWCRRDVQRLHGGYGGDPFLACPDGTCGPAVIYPDETPTIELMPERLQMPVRGSVEEPCPPAPERTWSVPGEARYPVTTEVIPAPDGAMAPSGTVRQQRYLPSRPEPAERQEPVLRPEPAEVPSESYPVMPRLKEPPVRSPGLPTPEEVRPREAQPPEVPAGNSAVPTDRRIEQTQWTATQRGMQPMTTWKGDR